jgi:predicted metalloprotease with PDZ domain
VREAAEAVSHADLGWFFAKYVAGTEEIPWDEFFRSVGLRVIKKKNSVPDVGFSASRDFDGPMKVEAVTAGSEAERAGVRVGETVVQINGVVPGQDSTEHLAGLNQGDTITLKVRGRRGDERELKWKLGSRDEVSYALKDMEKVSPEQHARRTAWLNGEAQAH